MYMLQEFYMQDPQTTIKFQLNSRCAGCTPTCKVTQLITLQLLAK